MANAIEWLKENNKFDNMDDASITQYIFEEYIGTCDAMSEEDFEWLDENGQLEAIDYQMFHCEGCGWWCRAEEQVDVQCSNCEGL